MCFLLLLKWEQTHCMPTAAFGEEHHQIFSGFRKEQRLSSWELSACGRFMHELLTGEIPISVPTLCCRVPAQMCHLFIGSIPP